MRTTVRIDDDLLAELKKRAEDESLTRVLNETLRRGIASEDGERERKIREYRETTYSLGEPLVDLTKALALSFATDDEKVIRLMGGGAATVTSAESD
jgi:hypothetical protein